LREGPGEKKSLVWEREEQKKNMREGGENVYLSEEKKAHERRQREK